jgi:hypothetical protein
MVKAAAGYKSSIFVELRSFVQYILISISGLIVPKIGVVIYLNSDCLQLELLLSKNTPIDI